MVDETLKIQRSFHEDITKYINGAAFSKIDIFYSFFYPFFPFVKYSKPIVKKYKSFIANLPKETKRHKKFYVEYYKGKNIYVHKMKKYLENHLREDLIGAYVHGSLGTYEEIRYSDFDALIILSSEVFEKHERLSKVAYWINKSRLIMFEFDPLQHHGWFILTQADLDIYPEYYFPSHLFKFAKSLFPDKGSVLNIHSHHSSDLSRCQFFRLSNGIIKQIEEKKYPQNLYQLKSLLSRFMLLPSLYFQAHNNKTIFKKMSFVEVKKIFTPEEWKIMDAVSSIRNNWEYEISVYKKWLMTRPGYMGRYFAKHYSPRIPHKALKNLKPQFYFEMKDLVVLMQDKLKSQ